MRSSAEIMKEIEILGKQDALYNRIQNEGGEGFYRDSTEALREEYKLAKEREFPSEWTLEVLSERRKQWNAYAIEHNICDSLHPLLFKFVRENGWGPDQLIKAKKLHGIV